MQSLTIQNTFDSIKHIDDMGNEFWFARELQPLLGYAKWQNFEPIILKVIQSFEVLGQNASDWVIATSKPYESGNGRLSQATEYKLTKQACYLIAMNCDSSKNEVALAQQYFAAMTIFAEQFISNSTYKRSETEIFSEANYKLTQKIGDTARELARENNQYKARIQELEARLSKLEAPVLPPTDGIRIKELLRCCGVTIDSNDGNLFSRLALDLRKAVETGILPKYTIAGRGRYRYLAEVKSWVCSWLSLTKIKSIR